MKACENRTRDRRGRGLSNGIGGQESFGGRRWAGFLKRHRLTALFLFLILTVLGGVRALSLPVSLYPSIDFPRISVIVTTQDLPFSQMEVRVTRPVAMALRGVTGAREVRSRTSRGSAEFFVRFSWTTPMVLALSRVNQALTRILPDLPPGSRSRAIRMISADTPVYQIALTSRDRSLAALTDLARYRLLPFLVNIPGVWKVEILGARTREVHVEVNPYQLAGAGKTMNDVLTALPDHNRIGVVGRISSYHQILLLEVHNALGSLREVRNLFLPGMGAAPLPLSQVATVDWGVRPADRTVRVSAFGQPSVLLNVFRVHRENTLALVNRIRSRQGVFDHLLPPGVRGRVTYDQGHVIGQAVLHVSIALGLGILSAFVVILLFLRRLRPFLLVATFVPMILCITLGLLSLLHQSLNLMTLGGLAAGVGLVIDDFVVILEGRDRLLPLLKPFIFSSLATIVVLLPLFDLGGLVGAFFMPLALTLLILLTLSLLVNLFVTPGFMSPEEKKPEDVGSLPFLPRLMAVPRMLLPAFLVLFFALSALVLSRDLPTNFMPRMDEGAFLVDIHAPPGTSLADSDRAFRRIESYLGSLPEVASTSRRLGAEMGFYITEPNKGDIIVRLKDDRSRSVFEVIDQVRSFVRTSEPELTVDFAQILEDMLNDLIGTEAPVVVRIHGDDRSRMDLVVPRVIALLDAVPGVVDVARSERPVVPARQIRIDSELAASYHLTPRTVIGNLRTGLWGTRATTMMEGPIPRSVRVLDSPELFKTLEGVRHFPVETPTGLIPLSRIARWSDEALRPEQDDQNLSPVVAVSARLSGSDLGTVSREIRTRIASLALPPSVWIELGGYAAWQKRSFHALTLALFFAVILMAGVVFALFRRFWPPVLLLAGAFFSVVVALLTLVAFRHSLNISSFVGLILVAGISAENGLLVLDRARNAGGSPGERFRRAMGDRLIPLLMTHSANILALLPLAVASGAGLDMERSFAIAVIGGLLGSFLSSTLLVPLLGVSWFPASLERSIE